MWDQNEQGRASFFVNGWRLQVVCEPDAVRLVTTHDSSIEVTGLISLVGGELPPIKEMFVRGDELHLAMPQQDDSDVGLDLVLMVIKADRDCLVVESTLAVQTLLWDAHPMIELTIPGTGSGQNSSADSALVYSRSKTVEGAPLVSVMIDERDQLSIDSTSFDGDNDAAETGLRLFGEFMERGVIRKTQPWWVWSCNELDAAHLGRLADELAKRPLPLAT